MRVFCCSDFRFLEGGLKSALQEYHYLINTLEIIIREMNDHISP